MTPSPSGWEQHVLRAHLQKEVWRSALLPHQPDSEPTPQGKGWVLVDREWRPVFSRLPPCPAALSGVAVSAEDPATAEGGEEEEEDEEEGDPEETEDEQDDGDADADVCRETAMENMAAASAAAVSDVDEPAADEQDDSSEEEEGDEVRHDGWTDEAPKHRVSPATHASWMKVGARLAMKVAMFSHCHPQGSKDVWWLATVTGGFGFTSAREEWKGKIDLAYDSDGGSVQPWKPQDRWRFRLANCGPGPGDGRWVLLDDPANEQQAGKEQVKSGQRSKRTRKSTANNVDYAYDGSATKRSKGAPVAAASAAAAAPTAAVAHPSTKQGRRGGAQEGDLQPKHKPKRAGRSQGGSKGANAK